MPRVVVIAVGLLLASCGTPAVENATGETGPSNASGSGQNTTATVLTLSDRQRRATLMRAIRDADIDCQDVTAADLVSRPGEPPQWRARCSDGNAYLVDITANGTAHVIGRPD